MGNTDSIPVISQTKSLVQTIAGDTDGAKRTQENFSKQCPVVSQCRSLGQTIGGDSKGAKETQEEFLDGLDDFSNGFPVVGHIKGGIYYATGDTEKGDEAMKAASRTTAVMAGGVAGGLAGGPAGAAAGAFAAGQACDGITTGIDSAVHHEYRPNGSLIGGIQRCIDKKGDKTMSGDIFDMVAESGMDCMQGYGIGKGIKSMPRAKGVTMTEVRDVHPTEPINQSLKRTEFTEGPHHVEIQMKNKNLANYGLTQTMAIEEVKGIWKKALDNETKIGQLKYAVKKAWIGQFSILEAIWKLEGQEFLTQLLQLDHMVDWYELIQDLRSQ